MWDMNKAECDDYLEKALSGIPENFSGKLLEVPVGTEILTMPVHRTLPNAEITCLDYSPDERHRVVRQDRRLRRRCILCRRRVLLLPEGAGQNAGAENGGRLSGRRSGLRRGQRKGGQADAENMDQGRGDQGRRRVLCGFGRQGRVVSMGPVCAFPAAAICWATQTGSPCRSADFSASSPKSATE